MSGQGKAPIAYVSGKLLPRKESYAVIEEYLAIGCRCSTHACLGPNLWCRLITIHCHGYTGWRSTMHAWWGGLCSTASLLPPDLLEGKTEWQHFGTIPRSKWYQGEEEPLTIIVKGRGHVVKHGWVDYWTTYIELSVVWLLLWLYDCLCCCIYVICSWECSVILAIHVCHCVWCNSPLLSSVCVHRPDLTPEKFLSVQAGWFAIEQILIWKQHNVPYTTVNQIKATKKQSSYSHHFYPGSSQWKKLSCLHPLLDCAIKCRVVLFNPAKLLCLNR